MKLSFFTCYKHVQCQCRTIQQYCFFQRYLQIILCRMFASQNIITWISSVVSKNTIDYKYFKYYVKINVNTGTKDKITFLIAFPQYCISFHLLICLYLRKKYYLLLLSYTRSWTIRLQIQTLFFPLHRAVGANNQCFFFSFVI